MAIPTIDVPTALVKADLREIVPYRGALNATPMQLNGTEYPAFALVFIGFAGGCLRGATLFEGAYRFRLAQPKDSENESHDLTLLPKLPDVSVIETELISPDTESAAEDNSTEVIIKADGVDASEDTQESE